MVAEAYASIDTLLNDGKVDEARALLEAHGDDPTFLVLRIKLDLYDGSMAPGLAMQRLIQLMRKNPDEPGAKVLYQEASRRAYSGGQSSVSHSHPPPPVDTDEKQ